MLGLTNRDGKFVYKCGSGEVKVLGNSGENLTAERALFLLKIAESVLMDIIREKPVENTK